MLYTTVSCHRVLFISGSSTESSTNSLKKPRNRNIFSNFLCCFGNTNNNNTQTSNCQVPVVEENGNPRVRLQHQNTHNQISQAKIRDSRHVMYILSICISHIIGKLLNEEVL